MPMTPWHLPVHKPFHNAGQMWDAVPTAFAKTVAIKLPGAEVRVGYHKADVIIHSNDIIVSQRCHSFRPEAQVWLNDKKVMIAYFGMGQSGVHEDIYSFVAFVFTAAALRAVQNVMQKTHGRPRAWIGSPPENPSTEGGHSEGGASEASRGGDGK